MVFAPYFYALFCGTAVEPARDDAFPGSPTSKIVYFIDNSKKIVLKSARKKIFLLTFINKINLVFYY